MIKIEHTQVFGWEAAIRGMRAPMNSWEKSDSYRSRGMLIDEDKYEMPGFYIGPNDHDLMMRLVKAGDEHAKFMRMIHVSMDILAPLYWWKQADTYKVGFVTNSCSTMHKIHAKEFEIDDFSHEHLITGPDSPFEIMHETVVIMNTMRKLYVDTKDKKYWQQLIQLLPDSYNQLRTCDTNYATLRKMYHQRKGHRLDEWESMRSWIKTLPYSELITND